MKFGKLILGAALVFSTVANAQDEVEKNECNRFKAVAGNAYKAEEYKKAATNYLNAEKECEGLEMAFYKPLMYALQVSVDATADAEKFAYIDTLLGVYDRAQKQHGEQLSWKTTEGYYYYLSNRPDKSKKMDAAFQKGLFTDKSPDEGLIAQYAYNLYSLYSIEKDLEAKAAYKKRIITEYFKLADIISANKMAPSTLETVTTYLDYTVTDCAAVLPEVDGFIKTLPEDKDAKASAVKNLMALLEKKECTKSVEYGRLVDIMVEIDPTSVDAKLAKAKYLIAQGKMSDAISVFKEAKGLTTDADQISEIEYTIANSYYTSGRYKAAHDAGLAVTGKFSKDGAKIAANSVIKMMNNCGDTTIERKANALYAVQIANKYGFSASAYEAQAPSGNDLFSSGKSKGEKITLACWGVSVTL